MRELNVNEIKQVNGGLTPTEGLGAVGATIAVVAAASTVGTVAVVAGLAGIIGIVAIDIASSISRFGGSGSSIRRRSSSTIQIKAN
ncbi:hypothetical protein J7384_18235 [Endozoicomonas sp. G2_1]|uniref:hypothetical protein n=1 Tax=Endozoicomonas sp. G2_1 TaxID=2821091 RepID=UPI001ADC2A2E|nr:hypothetical protein [Endozoicomonas sp. G2_1]MBO9492306.1 hypothetical protein [Endozoicomonas sp. G2_1]